MTPRDAPTSPKADASNQDNSAEAASSVHPGESERSLLRQASDAILAQWDRDSDLSGLAALWQALDDLATQTGQQERRATTERVVVSGIGGVLTVGYVVWSVPRGCLLALTGTSTPLWRNWDVLSVLSVDSKRRGPVKKNPPAKEGPESVLG
jgi:hypothetical protein